MWGKVEYTAEERLIIVAKFTILKLVICGHFAEKKHHFVHIKWAIVARNYQECHIHTNTRLHTCPSTIHLEIAVLPSLPGRNLMVAERGLMLEMTRFDGAPGSSVRNRNTSIYVTIGSELKHHDIFTVSLLSAPRLHYPSKQTHVNRPITHFRVD